MKLLYVHDRFGGGAGADGSLLLTATELKRRGHEIGIIHGLGNGMDRAEWDRTFSHRYLLTSHGKNRSMLDALDRFKPDVVFVHQLSDLSVLRALVSSRRPLARMVHDHDLYCMRRYRYAPFSRRICMRPVSRYCVFPCGAFLIGAREGRLSFQWNSLSSKKKEVTLNQRFNRMLVASHYMKEQLLLNGFDGRRIEVHPPIPRPSDNPIQSSFCDRNLILYSGQITRGAGVDVLLESLALVRTHFECVILGEGRHRAYCERLSKRLGMQHRVSFRGWISPQELREYYRECSAVVISSLWPEPIGLSGLEAMGYGLPVVAFDAGGIKDWLTDGYNGYLVPWMEKAAFAGRVERLLNDKDLAQTLGQRGLNRISRDYNYDESLRNLERTLSQVATEGPCGADDPNAQL